MQYRRLCRRLQSATDVLAGLGRARMSGTDADPGSPTCRVSYPRAPKPAADERVPSGAYHRLQLAWLRALAPNTDLKND